MKYKIKYFVIILFFLVNQNLFGVYINLDEFNDLSYNKESEDGNITLSLNYDNYIDSGKSLEVSYYLKYIESDPPVWGMFALKKDFNSPLDLSGYDYISFYLKSVGTPTGGTFWFSLKLSNNKYYTHISDTYITATNWERIKIPLKSFPSGEANNYKDGFAPDIYEPADAWDITKVYGYKIELINSGIDGNLKEDHKDHNGSILIDNLMAVKDKKETGVVDTISVFPLILTPSNGDDINDVLNVGFTLNKGAYIEFKIYTESGELKEHINKGVKNFYSEGTHSITISKDILEKLEQGVYILYIKIQDITGKNNESIKKVFVIY